MGNIFSHGMSDKRVQKIIDKVFYELADMDRDQDQGRLTMNFAELYIGILLVYNEINKLTNVHSDPPRREEVAKMLQEFDANHDGALDRQEFEGFVLHFTKGATKQVTKNLFVECVLVPALVFATKSATRPVKRVGPVVQRIPEALMTVGYLGLLSAVGLKVG